MFWLPELDTTQNEAFRRYFLDVLESKQAVFNHIEHLEYRSNYKEKYVCVIYYQFLKNLIYYVIIFTI